MPPVRTEPCFWRPGLGDASLAGLAGLGDIPGTIGADEEVLPGHDLAEIQRRHCCILSAAVTPHGVAVVVRDA
jgi:hypothetical protein